MFFFPFLIFTSICYSCACKNEDNVQNNTLIYIVFFCFVLFTKEYFRNKARTKINKKKSRDKTQEEKVEDAQAIRIRHGGVLGLCAFVQAHPYDVPKFLPLVFEYLGPHLNDPQPIPVS